MTQSLVPNDDQDHAVATRPANDSSFGPPAKRDAAVETEAARAIAEVQAAMVIAQRFPRDQITALDRIKNACAHPGLAERAMYSYARGGTEITGPSIRLAEALAQNWGNMQWGTRELEQRPGRNGQPGESTVESFAWDVETNSKATKLFQQPHVRDTRKGPQRLTETRDVYELIANNGARRVRACILGVIPIYVQQQAVTWCEQTLATTVKVTPERIKAMLAEFAKLGVSQKAIEARIQRRIEAITPMQIVDLTKKFNSINDGMSVPGDWFEIEAAVPATPATAKAKLDRAAAEPEPEPVVEEASEAERFALLSGPELSKALKALGKEVGLDEGEINNVVADCGGWGKAKANVEKIVAKLREAAPAT
jgi:hypothetical protein